MLSDKRVGVFVDLTSMFGAVKSQFNGAKIDYAEYLKKVGELGTIQRAFAYGSYIADEAIPFITCLHNVGFEPKYVQADLFDGRHNIKKTNRLMDLVVDILRLIDRVDIVVISTLNKDIIPFIHYLKERGIKVVLFSCNVKSDLRQAADVYWPINTSVLEVPEPIENASIS